MESHDKRYDGEDGQFNCKHCPFQGNSSELLSSHMGEAHLLKCHNCDQTFRIKQDLMQHRKSEHFDKIRVCKYFNDGNCSFNTSCWYKHTTEVETTTNADQQVFKCNSCGSTFQGRGELVMHLKKIHYKTISKCKSFEK